MSSSPSNTPVFKGLDLEQPMIVLSDHWRDMYPNSHIGLLAMQDVCNPESHPRLDLEKRRLEEELRRKFGGLDNKVVRTLGIVKAYTTYYKRFKKTYHVLQQLESVIYKEKSIPRVACLVEAMFMAELKNQLLTAGHDLDQLKPPILVNAAIGTECYTLMRGEEHCLKASDMLIADQDGVISSIIYGPDQRTQITGNTRNVLFSVYAPDGIDSQQIQTHLNDIQGYVFMFCPAAKVAWSGVFPEKN